jgi:DNA-binding IclR family transcriptional regulator
VQTGLREDASPYLHDLYGATLATVHLAVRDGTSVLYVDRLRGHASVPVVSSIGSRLPLHTTGVGKVLLAHAPPEVQNEVLADLSRVTPYSITQPGTLRRQLARVVRDGYATTVEEMSLGACSVAVPIRRGGDVVASLGLVVASLRKDRPRLVAALQVAARGIERAIGHTHLTG